MGDVISHSDPGAVPGGSTINSPGFAAGQEIIVYLERSRELLMGPK